MLTQSGDVVLVLWGNSADVAFCLFATPRLTQSELLLLRQQVTCTKVLISLGIRTETKMAMPLRKAAPPKDQNRGHVAIYWQPATHTFPSKLSSTLPNLTTTFCRQKFSEQKKNTFCSFPSNVCWKALSWLFSLKVAPQADPGFWSGGGQWSFDPKGGPEPKICSK